MKFSLKDRVVIITGASSGIGAALGIACAQQGAKVVLASRSENQLKELAQQIESRGGQVLSIRTDVSLAEDRQRLIEQTVERWKQIDVLVNNAGYSLSGDWHLLPIEEIRKNFETNVFAPVVCAQLALPYLRQTRGMIVNIESIVGLRAMPVSSSYSATKHALHAFSEAMRMELGAEGVHVLSVCPGLIATRFHSNRVHVGTCMEKGPSSFYMPVEECAEKIVKAMERRKSQIVITGHAKLIAFLQRLSPRLLDWLFKTYYRSGIRTLNRKAAAN
jgi:dehydrogenase/reductase SDR family member 7B